MNRQSASTPSSTFHDMTTDRSKTGLHSIPLLRQHQMCYHRILPAINIKHSTLRPILHSTRHQSCHGVFRRNRSIILQALIKQSPRRPSQPQSPTQEPRHLPGPQLQRQGPLLWDRHGQRLRDRQLAIHLCSLHAAKRLVLQYRWRRVQIQLLRRASCLGLPMLAVRRYSAGLDSLME
jgi:hypothetical protein